MDNEALTVAVTGPSGEPRAITAAARTWQDELNEIAPGRFEVLLRAVVTGTRAAATGTFQARVQTASGGWVVLQGSRLIGDEEQVVVTIEPASGHHLVGMLLAAYGLTTREREICPGPSEGRVRQGRRTQPRRTGRHAPARRPDGQARVSCRR